MNVSTRNPNTFAELLYCIVKCLLFCPLCIFLYRVIFFPQSAVTLDELFSFLMHFRADESLCRGTQIWNQVKCIRHMWGNTQHQWSPMVNSFPPYISVTPLQLCTWLSDNECSFKPSIRGGDSSSDAPKKETVRSYVQAEIHDFLRVPASTGRSEVRPSWIKWIIQSMSMVIFRFLHSVQVIFPAPQVRLRGYRTVKRPIS